MSQFTYQLIIMICHSSKKGVLWNRHCYVRHGISHAHCKGCNTRYSRGSLWTQWYLWRSVKKITIGIFDCKNYLWKVVSDLIYWSLKEVAAGAELLRRQGFGNKQQRSWSFIKVILDITVIWDWWEALISIIFRDRSILDVTGLVGSYIFRI